MADSHMTFVQQGSGVNQPSPLTALALGHFSFHREEGTEFTGSDPRSSPTPGSLGSSFGLVRSPASMCQDLSSWGIFRVSVKDEEMTGTCSQCQYPGGPSWL